MKEMNEAANLREVIPESHFRKKFTTTGIMLTVFSLIVAIIGQIYLYYFTKSFLEIHYSEILLRLVDLKESLFIKSLLVNILFFVIPSIFFAAALVYYSHRVAGPMYRTREYMRQRSTGPVPDALKFRDDDVLHTLSVAVNKVQDLQKAREEEICANYERMEQALAKAETLAQNGSIDGLLEEVRSSGAANEELLQRVKA
ncbi:MAG: hypothetical protein Q8J90_03650 [Gallionella sp.]|nr:hypothetical protein [Gallionella sp.]